MRRWSNFVIINYTYIEVFCGKCSNSFVSHYICTYVFMTVIPNP